MAFALRCPDCRDAFPWDVKLKFPRYCPLCKADLGEERADDDVVMPFIRTSGATKATDQVYRDMEKASEARAEKAAEQLGVSVSEMSDLKITNMLDNRKEGEISVPPVVNAVTQQMDFIKAQGGTAGFGDNTAVEYSQQVQTGPHPNMGAKMRKMIHAQNGVSDRPALETLQPGYRVRA